MANAKAKRIRNRLEEIRAAASQMSADASAQKKTVALNDPIRLAEEAAQLGLELADLQEEK